MSEASRTGLPPLTHGTVVNDRYEIRQSLGKGGMGEVFLAYDRTTQQTVALKIVREESRMPGDDEALRQELLLARSVEPPERVPRARPRAEPVGAHPGDGAHHRADAPHAHPPEEGAGRLHGRRVPQHRAATSASGVAAIHAQGLVHGDLKPGNVMVTRPDGSSARPSSSTSASRKERARASARRPGAPPDGGTPNYMAPERIRTGGASAEDDVYALALTLWEMWTCRVPEPGYKPRAKTMRQQIMFDVPAGLSIDEVKQIFRCLAEDPQHAPAGAAPALLQPDARSRRTRSRSRASASIRGRRRGAARRTTFAPGAQALLVTYATNAPEYRRASSFALDKPLDHHRPARRQDIVRPRGDGQRARTRSSRWQNGLVDRRGHRLAPTARYVDHNYEREDAGRT